MIVHISDPQNLPENLYTLSKVVGYKINSTKLVTLLYTNDKQPENKIRETTPFTIAKVNAKYLGVTVTKKVKDLYEKNTKSLRKKLKKISEDGKIFHVHGILGLT